MIEFIVECNKVVDWCNVNTGFLSGVLAFLTLVVSIIAIVVSIKTARLPYKKIIEVSSGINFLTTQNNVTGDVKMEFSGFVVNAVNLGNRNVNLTFLGFAIKGPDKELKTMQCTKREMGGKGILEPTKIVSVEYTIPELMAFGELSNNAKIYYCAMDSEGTTYKKYYGRVEQLITSMQKLLHCN